MAARAFSVLDSFIYGFARQQLNMAAGPDSEPEESTEAFLRAIPADEYPDLREMVVDYAMVSNHDERADFEFGLDLVLGGLERLLPISDELTADSGRPCPVFRGRCYPLVMDPKARPNRRALPRDAARHDAGAASPQGVRAERAVT